MDTDANIMKIILNFLKFMPQVLCTFSIKWNIFCVSELITFTRNKHKQLSCADFKLPGIFFITDAKVLTTIFFFVVVVFS